MNERMVCVVTLPEAVIVQDDDGDDDSAVWSLCYMINNN